MIDEHLRILRDCFDYCGKLDIDTRIQLWCDVNDVPSGKDALVDSLKWGILNDYVTFYQTKDTPQYKLTSSGYLLLKFQEDVK